jgi:hypothetical protein
MSRLSCLKCWSLLPAHAAGEGTSICASCGSAWSIDAFPALFDRPAPLQKEELELAEGEASCFHHASKRAATSCSRCGRFLCALCALELGGETWCATCLSTGATEKRVHSLETRRILWDSVALGIAIIPLVTLIGLYFLIFTAPAAIFVALRYWNRPGSVLPRTKGRFVLTIAIASAELGLWSFMAYMVFRVVAEKTG